MFPTHPHALIVARGMGWVSVALGVAALLGARGLSRMADRPEFALLAGAQGLRSVVNGAALLRSGRPERWLWIRLGGDLIDLAIAALAVRNPKTRNEALGVFAALATTTVVRMACARRLSTPEARAADDPDRRGGRARTVDPIHVRALRNFEPEPNRSATSEQQSWHKRSKPPLREAR